MPADRAHDEIPTIAEDGALQRLSVSTIQKAEECPRRFYFAKRLHLQEPVYAAQQIGTEGHARLEHYIKTGEDVLGPLERVGLEHLPPPMAPGLLAEERFEWSIAGVPVTGFVDLIDLRFMKTASLRIRDYKFVSSLSAPWVAQKPEELTNVDHKHGIQMIGYAIAALARWPDTAAINLGHIQFQTRGARLARVVSTIVTSNEARAEWRKLEPLVERMKTWARAADAFEVPGAPEVGHASACERCPFNTRCLAQRFKTSSIKGAPSMGIMDRLLKPQPTSSVTEPPPPAAPPPGPSAVKPPAHVEVKMLIKDEPDPTPPDPAPAAPIAMLPPDAPKSDPKLAAEPLPAAPATAAPAPATAPVATAEAPKRRGRPPKVAAPSAIASADAIVVRELYVDCVPNTPTEPLSPYVTKLADELAKAAGAPDIRCASGEILGFGKWKGALAAAIKERPPAPGAYSAIVAGSEIMQVAVEALEPTCDVFVRGVR